MIIFDYQGHRPSNNRPQVLPMLLVADDFYERTFSGLRTGHGREDTLQLSPHRH